MSLPPQPGSEHVNDLYIDLLEKVLAEGEEVSPRGQRTLELRAEKARLYCPHNRWVSLPGRKANHAFALVESFQLATGLVDTAQQVRYNSKIADYADPDTGEIEVPYGVATREQVPQVVELLRKDPSSRQAVLSIYDGNQHFKPMLNVPCTCTLQFFLRNGALELVTYMRSNDLWWGFPYDVHQFTTLQELVSRALNVPMGPYTHVAGSLHLYEQFFEKAAAMVQDHRGAPQEQSPLFKDLSFDQARDGMTWVLETEAVLHGTEDERQRLDRYLPAFRRTDHVNFAWAIAELSQYQEKKRRKRA